MLLMCLFPTPHLKASSSCDIAGTFGVPVEEHLKESEVKQIDGYVSMGILTGKAPVPVRIRMMKRNQGGSALIFRRR